MFNTDKKKNIYDIEKSKKTIGKKINDLMNEKNVTIYKLCNDLNEHETIITRQTFSKVLNGEAELPLKPLMEICNYFNVSINYLLGETDYKSKEAETAAQYIGFSPKAIELLHNLKHQPPLFMLSYMFSYCPELIAQLINQLYDAVFYNNDKQIERILENNRDELADIDNDEEYRKLIDDYILFLKGQETFDTINEIHNYELHPDIIRLKMQDTIRDILDTVNPFFFRIEYINNEYHKMRENEEYPKYDLKPAYNLYKRIYERNQVLEAKKKKP